MRLAIVSLIALAIIFAGMAVPVAAANSGVEVYYFGSANCPTCAQTKPVIEELQQKNSWVTFHYSDAWTDSGAAQLKSLGVDIGPSIPIVIVFANGNVVWNTSGKIVSLVEMQTLLNTYKPVPTPAKATDTPKTTTNATTNSTEICEHCKVTDENEIPATSFVVVGTVFALIALAMIGTIIYRRR